ncbi:cytochrome P450 [Mycena albidolilacea]|uniref:Cytochrome P450 n=1 Tax=Mycena albidolilacea TaxID=1033008 RepID=A0AAD7AHL5_9AGAR|nr:cytochrome P450 [Mycena albidolilacea]
MALLKTVLTCCALLKILNRLLKPWYSPSPLRHLPGPPSQSWFAAGNLGQLFTAKGLPFHQELVDLYGGMVKVYGFFGDEQLYVSDPRALQSILVKEQDAYEETAVFVDTNRIIFGPGLVSTTGVIHKRQRKLVNPIFSPSNLRELVPTFRSVAERLTDVLANECRARGDSRGRRVIDMSEWMSRAALEAVGQTVLGYSFDPLDSPVNNPYTRAIRELIPTIFSLSLVRQFAPFLVRLGPAWMRRKLVEWTPNAAVQKVKRMSDVMHQTAVDILEDKREGLRREDGGMSARAKDIISLLLRANEGASSGDQLSEAELTGQMTVMIFGAQDTTSSALSRILYLLSIRPDIQQKIREEIRAVHTSDRQLSLDEISALPWLDAVLKETLRLYPPVPFVRRTALQERTIPFTGLSGNESAVTVPRGTTLFLGIAAANRLRTVWGPDATEWKPERWFERDLHHKVDSTLRLPGIYSGMMSFLGGKRSCIGYKFAQIEIKMLLIALVSRFDISPTADEIVWNLSQIISPSVRSITGSSAREEKGLPLCMKLLEENEV